MRNSRPFEFFIVDILIATNRIMRYTESFKSSHDFELAPEIIFDATMHEIELLGEALKYVLTTEELKELVKPEWRVIVDFRNVVAHEYFGIDIDEVFRAIKIDLPIFEKEFTDFLLQLKDIKRLLLVFDDVNQELEARGRLDSIAYLEKIRTLLQKR